MAGTLIVCHDVVGADMAGPGIRYWEMAGALTRRGLPVTLAAPRGSSFPPAPFATLDYAVGEPDLVGAATSHDALVVTGPILEQFPALKTLDRPIVVDLYDPFLFENLHRLGDTPSGWVEHEGGLRTLAEQARRGDLFICANERQRDLYLGMLAAWGRVSPTTYAADRTLEQLLTVVPFGLPAEPPQPGRGLRGAIPGVGPEDRVVVWNGGLWDWFDPDTAIRAVAGLAATHPTLRLVFLGTRHPNPAIGEPASAVRARQLADDLGMAGRHVFFREWTPYAERGACLLDADLAISLHLAGVETRYASRTRLLDCIWAALPLVTTEGDAIGDDLAARGLALATRPGEVDDVVSALDRLLAEQDARARLADTFAELRAGLTWDRAVEPLAAFLEAPRRSPLPVGEGGRRPGEGPPHPVAPAKPPPDPAASLPSPAARGSAWTRLIGGLRTALG